jgi:hypothetical protein
MSKAMRAVQERHGPATDLFVEPSDAVYVINLAATAVGSGVDETQYGDVTAVCVYGGAAFLDHLAGPDFTPESLAAEDETVAELSESDLASLVANMKTHAASWRELLGEEGSLTIYVDNPSRGPL